MKLLVTVTVTKQYDAVVEVPDDDWKAAKRAVKALTPDDFENEDHTEHVILRVGDGETVDVTKKIATDLSLRYW